MVKATVKKYYQEILSRLKANRGSPNKFFGPDYGGNRDPSLHVPNPIKRKIAKEFASKHQDISLKELLALISLLNKGLYSTEKSFGGLLFQYFPKLRVKVNPCHIDNWLNNLSGWSQVDSVSQSVFSAKDILGNWRVWRKTIIKLAEDKNINKPRASLVLLTAPVRQSTDKRLSRLAFFLIDKLKTEKNILITKAISWLLREMIKHHRSEVAAYLRKNKENLPKIAFRETRRKLETGRK